MGINAAAERSLEDAMTFDQETAPGAAWHPAPGPLSPYGGAGGIRILRAVQLIQCTQPRTITPSRLWNQRCVAGATVWGVICLNLRRASGTERHQPQSGRFRARSQSPSSVAYRLRKLATPIALGPGELLRLQASVDGTSWPSKEYAMGIAADFGHLEFRMMCAC